MHSGRNSNKNENSPYLKTNVISTKIVFAYSLRLLSEIDNSGSWICKTSQVFMSNCIIVMFILILPKISPFVWEVHEDPMLIVPAFINLLAIQFQHKETHLCGRYMKASDDKLNFSTMDRD